SPDRNVAIEAVRALGRLGNASATPVLMRLLSSRDIDPHLKLEALAALGTTRGINVTGVLDVLLDSLTDPVPAVSSTALRAVATLDPDEFFAVLSGLDADANWTVRATLADMLGSMAPDLALPRLVRMLSDSDQRVVPSVLGSLVKLKAPDCR